MSSVVWWEVETQEPDKFQQFHSELSHWMFAPAFRDTDLNADYWVIQKDGSDVGGLQRASSPVPSSGVRVYLQIEDLERTLDRVVALGGMVERSRVDLDGKQWFALFRDSADVLFGLWTANPPSPD